MLKQLQKIFPSLITNKDQAKDQHYQWYLTPEQFLVGIPDTDLTTKDKEMLACFLTPHNIVYPPMTINEQKWKDILSANTAGNNNITSNFRFVYFSFPKNKISPATFKEAINEIFTGSIAVLWENGHSGVMIEETAEQISYEQIVDVLMSDLYVKIRFFTGPFVSNEMNAKTYYDYLVQYAKTGFSHSDKPVITYIDAIPSIFIQQADTDAVRLLPNIVLQDTIDDQDLLHTIETFIKCNLNISVTAKTLYMHRNSLQYRIDKFMERTGIDIRSFQQTMTVYLALIAQKYLD